jgi:hypothetical protein
MLAVKTLAYGQFFGDGKGGGRTGVSVKPTIPGGSLGGGCFRLCLVPTHSKEPRITYSVLSNAINLLTGIIWDFFLDYSTLLTT